MKLVYILIALILVGCNTTGASITNFENQPIKRFDNRTLTDAEMQQAIRRAANSKGWKVAPGYAPNHIIATLTVNNYHKAIVDITFKKDSYSINYRDSEYLVYAQVAEDRGELLIHPNYNRWVGELNDEIYRQMQE